MWGKGGTKKREIRNLENLTAKRSISFIKFYGIHNKKRFYIRKCDLSSGSPGTKMLMLLDGRSQGAGRRFGPKVVAAGDDIIIYLG